MKEEISRIIKEHLPEAVAGEMKDFIEQANKNEAELVILKELTVTQKGRIDSGIEENAELKKEVAGLSDQIKVCEDCRQRYDSLIYKERELATVTACADYRINDMKELVSLVFKSPVFRKSETTTKTVPVSVSDNGYTRVECHSETERTDTEKSEE